MGVPGKESSHVYKQLMNIKSVFILAMHPSLRGLDFSQNNVKFSLKNYIGRIIYGEQQKNYNILIKRPK